LEWGGKLVFVNSIVGGAIDTRFMPAILKGIMARMEQGPLTGSYARDVRVIVYDGKMHPVDSNEVSFMLAGRNAFSEAFKNAGPKILEPIYDVEVYVPSDKMGDVMSDLQGRRAIIMGMSSEKGYEKLSAKVPLKEMSSYSTALSSLTGGRASFSMKFANYELVPNDVQTQLIKDFEAKEVKMRNQQFDAAVKRSLFQVSKDVEYNEAQRWLIEDTSDAERKALQSSRQGSSLVQQTQSYVIKSRDGSVSSEFKFKTIPSNSSNLPNAMSSHRHSLNTIPQTSQNLIEGIRNRYMYQRYLLDEVAWQMIYRSSDKSIGERIRYKDIDNYLQLDLLNEGIELRYHFSIIDKNGHVKFTDALIMKIRAMIFLIHNHYSRMILQTKMNILKIHFPARRDYIYSSINFMVPFVDIHYSCLLITFIYTLIIVFRQKKLTEMKNDFVNNMTHEFKTPISTISLAAQMLKDPCCGKVACDVPASYLRCH
jgi:hypothetical protein